MKVRSASLCFAVTFAFATTAPIGSLTVPVIAPEPPERVTAACAGCGVASRSDCSESMFVKVPSVKSSTVPFCRSGPGLRSVTARRICVTGMNVVTVVADAGAILDHVPVGVARA